MTEYTLPVSSTAPWLRDSLRRGPSLSLARLVENIESLDDFSFKTFAREGLSETELANFATGDKVSSHLADDWLMDLVASSPLTLNGIFLVEDWQATPDHQFLKEMQLPTLFVGREVYYVLRERDPRRVPHWQRIFSNTVPSFHAFLIEDDARLISGITVSPDLLREIAARLRMIICGAYDGESYVVATRNSIR